MKKLKSFLASRINWSAFLILLIALKDFITTFDFSKLNLQNYLLLGIGIAIIIFRTFGANVPVSDTGATKLNAKLNEQAAQTTTP